MAKRAGVGLQIIGLILLIAVMAIFGILWFDNLGLMNAKEFFYPVLKLVGLQSPTKIDSVLDSDLLLNQRIAKQWEAIDLEREALDSRENELETKEVEFAQKEAALEEERKILEEKENSFNETFKDYENRDKNLRQSVAYLNSMPPDDAVNRLLGMDDQDIIDLLRTADTVAEETATSSLTAYWLSLMPEERASAIVRKMIRKP